MWRSDSGTHGWSDVVHRVRIDPPYGSPYYIPATNYTDAGIAEGRVTRAGLARITAARRASYDSLLLLALFILSIETRLYDFTGVVTVAVSVFWFYTAVETSVLFLHMLHWRTRTYAWALLYLVACGHAGAVAGSVGVCVCAGGAILRASHARSRFF
jgi:hypothetical protein